MREKSEEDIVVGKVSGNLLLLIKRFFFLIEYNRRWEIQVLLCITTLLKTIFRTVRVSLSMLLEILWYFDKKTLLDHLYVNK